MTFFPSPEVRPGMVRSAMARLADGAGARGAGALVLCITRVWHKNALHISRTVFLRGWGNQANKLSESNRRYTNFIVH